MSGRKPPSGAKSPATRAPGSIEGTEARMSQALKNPSERADAPQIDRYGNPFDPIVRYARGTILKGTDEEISRMLRARKIVGDRVRNGGKESVYDLSGM